MTLKLNDNPSRREKLTDPIAMPISVVQYMALTGLMAGAIDFLQSVGDPKMTFEQAMAINAPYSLVCGIFGMPLIYSSTSPHTLHRAASTLMLACVAKATLSPIIAEQYLIPQMIKEQKMEQAPDSLIRTETIQEYLQREHVDVEGKTAYFRENTYDSSAVVVSTAGFGADKSPQPH